MAYALGSHQVTCTVSSTMSYIAIYGPIKISLPRYIRIPIVVQIMNCWWLRSESNHATSKRSLTYFASIYSIEMKNVFELLDTTEKTLNEVCQEIQLTIPETAVEHISYKADE